MMSVWGVDHGDTISKYYAGNARERKTNKKVAAGVQAGFLGGIGTYGAGRAANMYGNFRSEADSGYSRFPGASTRNFKNTKRGAQTVTDMGRVRTTERLISGGRKAAIGGAATAAGSLVAGDQWYRHRERQKAARKKPA